MLYILTAHIFEGDEFHDMPVGVYSSFDKAQRAAEAVIAVVEWEGNSGVTLGYPSGGMAAQTNFVNWGIFHAVMDVLPKVNVERWDIADSTNNRD